MNPDSGFSDTLTPGVLQIALEAYIHKDSGRVALPQAGSVLGEDGGFKAYRVSESRAWGLGFRV